VSFIASNQTRLITGVFPLSAFATQVDTAAPRATIDRTSLVDSAFVFIPGRRSATMSVNTMVDDDTTAGAYWPVITALADNGTEFPVTVAPAGFAAGNIVRMASAFEVTAAPTSPADGGVDMPLTYSVNGLMQWGESLTAHAAVTATGNGSTVDDLAATSNGGVAHLHVTAVAGTSSPTCTVLVQHSVNGSTGWDTLATFTQVTTSTSAQRVAVAAGTTVRRYLRASYTIAGTGPSYTLAVAFARN
jgi:hypothetical protein